MIQGPFAHLGPYETMLTVDLDRPSYLVHTEVLETKHSTSLGGIIPPIDSTSLYSIQTIILSVLF
jgi:tRNA(Ser,Leu) C12 N-acetylase TAN1